MKKNEPFSYQSQGLAETILADIDSLSKPVRKFLSTLFAQCWGVIGRYNFINMSRFMSYSEQALRNGFERGFDFFEMNRRLVKKKCSREIILAFDPTFIVKSGKHTSGLDYFWSGKDQRTKKGLELGCLAAVDVINQTAFYLDGIQTPTSKERKKKKITLIDHYRDFLLEKIDQLKEISSCLTVDGYFMKKDFILPLVENGMTVITKMRSDANLNYMYTGRQKKGRGRKRINGGKVNWKKLDMDKWEKVFSNKKEACYTAELFCLAIKMNVRIIYFIDRETGTHQIFLCTDVKMDAKNIMKYYRLRFQIEFLIRDGKQHSGLEDCQARSGKKLSFHFNMALTNVGLAKAKYYLPIPKKERDSFSLQDIKRFHHNALLANFIFSNLGIDMNCKKIKRLYQECTNFGRMAA